MENQIYVDESRPSNGTENTFALSSDAIGILAGVFTFVTVSCLFGIVTCCMMRRLKSTYQRSEFTKQSDISEASLRESGVLNDGYYLEVSAGISKNKRLEIASRHFMKNGFHVSDSRDLHRTNSSPPVTSGQDSIPIPRRKELLKHSHSSPAKPERTDKAEAASHNANQQRSQQSSLQIPSSRFSGLVTIQLVQPYPSSLTQAELSIPVPELTK